MWRRTWRPKQVPWKCLRFSIKLHEVIDHEIVIFRNCGDRATIELCRKYAQLFLVPLRLTRFLKSTGGLSNLPLSLSANSMLEILTIYTSAAVRDEKKPKVWVSTTAWPVSFCYVVHEYCRHRMLDVSETYSYSAHGTRTYLIQKGEKAFPRIRIILFGHRSLSFGSKLNLVFPIYQPLWCGMGVDVYESYCTAVMTECKTCTLAYLSKTYLCVYRQICDICHTRYWRWSQRPSSESMIFSRYWRCLSCEKYL